MLRKGYGVPWLVVTDGKQFYIKGEMDLIRRPHMTRSALYVKTRKGWRTDYRYTLENVLETIRIGKKVNPERYEGLTFAEFAKDHLNWHKCEGLPVVQLWDGESDQEVSYEQFMQVCEKMKV